MSEAANSDYDQEFADKWIANVCYGAATSQKRKPFHTEFISSLDVAVTCDKIKLSLAVTVSGGNRQLIRHRSQSAKAPFSPIPNLNFRLASRLLLAIAQIYRKQILDLYNEVSKLISNCKTLQIEAKKRKTSNPIDKICQKKLKCRRLSYRRLLYEAEELTQPSNFEQEELCLDIALNGESTSLTTTTVRVQEITIRDAETRDVNVTDDGFGNATPDEVQAFSDLFSDITLRNNNHLFGTMKRKNRFREILGIEPPAKRALVYQPIDENLPEVAVPEHDISPPPPSQENILQTTPTTPEDIQMVEENENRFNVLKRSLSMSEQKDFDVSSTKAKFPKVKRESKLIIDDVLKLEPKFQIKSEVDDKTHIKKILKEKIKLKRIKTIPSTFYEPFRGRGSCLLYNSSKAAKAVAEKNGKNQETYVDLIQEIFGYTVDNVILKLIYPNWNAKKKQNSRTKNNQKNTVLPVDTNLEDPILSIVPHVNFDYNNNEENDCSPLDTMKKLVEKHRDPNTIDIDAKKFCNFQGDRFRAAKTFHSLLVLQKRKLIRITNQIKSIKMDCIEFGNASNDLLNNVVNLQDLGL